MIKRGAWYQCGNQSQILVQDELENGLGVGAIISPRDLNLVNAKSYAKKYRDLGADILFDPQFYVPDFSKGWPEPYPTDAIRASVGTLKKLSAAQADQLSAALEQVNRDLGAAAVLAPAAVYESGRPDLQELNSILFAAAKRAGDALGMPTISSVVIGASAKGSDSEVSSILAHATGLPAAAAYLACEFDEDRIPSDAEAIERFGSACLTLAGAGRPVLHGFAGPMALLSLGFGATGTAIGQDQNLWQFKRARWEAPSGGGGSGNAPQRFFSASLWGTMVCPDELDQLDMKTRSSVMTHSPFSQSLAAAPKPSLAIWSKGDSKRHLVHVIAEAVTTLARENFADDCAKLAIDRLKAAEKLHSEISTLNLPIPLKNESKNTYQTPWRALMEKVLKDKRDDYDYLRL